MLSSSCMPPRDTPTGIASRSIGSQWRKVSIRIDVPSRFQEEPERERRRQGIHDEHADNREAERIQQQDAGQLEEAV